MRRREEPVPILSTGLSHMVMGGLAVYAALFALEIIPENAVALRKVAGVVTPPPTPASKIPPAEAGPLAGSSAAPSAQESADGSKEEWSNEDILRSKEQCMHVLAGTAAEIEWQDPIRKGECGLPVPVRLKSLGSDPKVLFDPPVEVSCPLVAALGKWVKATLQPKARERLKSEVVGIVRASGYSCRNIYNRPGARLSQHALANAIDIGGFKLANGKTVFILKSWGPTKRDLKAHAEALAQAKAKKSPPAMKAAQTGEIQAASEAPAGQSSKKIVQASMTPPLVSGEKKAAQAAAAATSAPEPPKLTQEGLFLRAIHEDACNEFATVLGPEANDPHRNHFHFDLISRPGRAYCR